MSKKDSDDQCLFPNYIDHPKQYISSWFNNFNDDSVLKAAPSITEPLLWPNDRAALLLFLEDHLDSLINHFDYVDYNWASCRFNWAHLQRRLAGAQASLQPRRIKTYCKGILVETVYKPSLFSKISQSSASHWVVLCNADSNGMLWKAQLLSEQDYDKL